MYSHYTSAHFAMLKWWPTKPKINRGWCDFVLSLWLLTVHSKSVFLKIFPDGQQIWEMEATVDKDKSQPVSTRTR